MSKLHDNIGALAAKAMQAALTSGLTWDESVAAFGLASKALADGAAKEGDGTVGDCHSHAKKRFNEAFLQDVRLFGIEQYHLNPAGQGNGHKFDA